MPSWGKKIRWRPMCVSLPTEQIGETEFSSIPAEPQLVLVTGASGYIATHVVQQLQEEGYQVRGTVRSLQNATKVEPLRKLCRAAKYPVDLVEADLSDPSSWTAAVEHCHYVIHVASSLHSDDSLYEDEVIDPAVDEMLNVLRACYGASTVKRVVLTSTLATIESRDTVREDHVYTESDWTNTEHVVWIYAKTKTLVEKAAWNYHSKLPEADRFELAVVNPGHVIGPVLCGAEVGSMEIPRQLLQREISVLPNLSFPCVDVRDVAAAHVAAMLEPEAAGHRHILCTETMWLGDIAELLDEEFQPQGYEVPTTVAPYPVLWLLGRFDQAIKDILPFIDTVWNLDNSRMRNVLKVTPIDIRKSWLDMCHSMIERGFIGTTSEYTGPHKE